jgi:hypothetical protein
MTSYIGGEVTPKAMNEPPACRNGAVCTKPEFRVKGEQPVTGGKIFTEGAIRVIVRSELLENDPIALKKLVRLVSRKEKGETLRQ